MSVQIGWFYLCISGQLVRSWYFVKQFWKHWYDVFRRLHFLLLRLNFSWNGFNFFTRHYFPGKEGVVEILFWFSCLNLYFMILLFAFVDEMFILFLLVLLFDVVGVFRFMGQLGKTEDTAVFLYVTFLMPLHSLL